MVLLSEHDQKRLQTWEQLVADLDAIRLMALRGPWGDYSASDVLATICTRAQAALEAIEEE